jgi:hypothetical protein
MDLLDAVSNSPAYAEEVRLDCKIFKRATMDVTTVEDYLTTNSTMDVTTVEDYLTTNSHATSVQYPGTEDWCY